MHPVLQRLIEAHTDGVVAGLQEALDRDVLNFRRDLFPLLATLDAKIPGIGMHYAVWDRTTPHYPFSKEFDGVVRPLRYIPYELASGIPFQMMARHIVANSGGHLEECVKELCRVNGCPPRYYNHPLGSLVRKRPVRSLLAATLTDAIAQFCQISWNRAKHQYSDGYPKSVISVEDAIGSYFAARALGAEVLIAADRVEALVQAIEHARHREQFYVTGWLPTVADDDVAWPVRDPQLAERGSL